MSTDTTQAFPSLFPRPFPAGNTCEKKRAPELPGDSATCQVEPAARNADPAPSTTVGAGVGVACSLGDGPRPVHAESPVEGARGEKGRVMLSERDRGILRLCYEQTFLLREHVECFFGDASGRRINQRLKVLEDGGFLTRSYFPELGPKAVIRLSKRGESVALQSGARNTRQPARLNPKTLAHDAIVTTCRQKILRHWNAEFIPERAIKTRDFPEIPDGIFFFRSGRGIALEVENSDKGRTRFLRLLERWKGAPSIVFVLFVATTDRLFETLSRYLSSGPEDQPMGVVRFSELISAGDVRVRTKRGPVALFDRREF